MKKTTIAQMFSPDVFRQCGHQLIDILAAHLEQQLSGNGNVLNWREPLAEDKQWQQALPQQANIDVKGLLEKLRSEILPASLAIHHPHNLGHQVATPLPIAALCDLVAALTNQAMAVYEAGPSATMLERQVLRWLGELIGWNDCAGVLTSGGAQANLTTLLAARQHSADWDVWQQGLSAKPGLCILASEHAHYSIARAAGIMGLGADAVIKVATDQNGRMLLSALDDAYKNSIKHQQKVIAVVASAGCTPTGSIDPLRKIGEFCQQHQLWLHVDGAHGASTLLSKQHRELLDGIELADSVVWDGHKLLYMPATVSAVLFRDSKTSYAAFNQDASYLFNSGKMETEAFNVSYRTIECTKRMMALKLWAAFSLYGVDGIGDLVDEAFAKAAMFAEKLKAQPDFELLMTPQTNIVCFRFVGSNVAPDKINQALIRNNIVQSGEFHLTQVELHGELWLRTTLMNPFTTETDLDELIQSVRKHSAQ